MMNEGTLVSIPLSHNDEGTQRCRLGPSVMDILGAKVGSAAWITTSPDIARRLCTLWPKHHNSTQYIQTATLVTEGTSTTPETWQKSENITLKNIEIVPDVTTVSVVSVTVVFEDIKQVSPGRKHTSETCDAVRCVLRGLVVSKECVVHSHMLTVGQLCGVSYVIVHGITVDVLNCSHGKVCSGTHINITGSISRERYEQKQSLLNEHHRRGLHGLGGLDRELTTLKELVELPLLCGAKDKSAPMQIPKGLLLQGPPGCGKTSLVRHLASECDAFLYTINGPEVYGSRPGETEATLRQIFLKITEMSNEGPCILFLDEVDALCPAKGRDGAAADRRIVTQLLHLLDQVNTVAGVIVIAATNNSASLDPAIRRPGRLEKEVLIGIPNLEKRKAILKVVTNDLPLMEDVDLAYVAECTPGFVGADLLSLVQHAEYTAVQNRGQRQTLSGQGPHDLDKVFVSQEDIKNALHSITPSTQRDSDIIVDHKPLSWDHIGGLQQVKAQLQQAVEWPLKFSESFRRLGIPRPKGVLLYGPPGCAKTTLVRAAASSCKVTFLSISGGQLYSPYVGDSERKLTQVFQQARAGAPTILFIDELDSVIGSRNKGEGTKGVQERVLSTLLNEMDGIGLKVDDITRSHSKTAEGQALGSSSEVSGAAVDNTDILVVAATNRPDMLDDAVLRPGRIDRIIYVPPPDTQSRLSILKVHTKKMPLSGVDLQWLAESTDGFTGADLENLCREAALHSLSVDGVCSEKVTTSHFTHVLSSARPSLTRSQLQHYENIHNKLNLKSS